jgi:hypothetical protein
LKCAGLWLLKPDFGKAEPEAGETQAEYIARVSYVEEARALMSRL